MTELTLTNTYPRAALDAFTPSPFNPRTRFKDAPLRELADSIAVHGVLQPIVVRPITWRDGYEIVAGERRWRASRLAGVTDIPYIARELTALQAMELQAIENIQREDPHPIEEADSYDHLLHPPTGEAGYTVDEIAARVGKSAAHIRSCVTLCRLIPDARDAFYGEALTKGTAMLLAGMPPTIQGRALQALLEAQQRQNGHHLSVKAASELLQSRFMLRLERAPFDTGHAELLPEAGACKACPKRTGANPDLFADVPSADTCTDPDCYSAKVHANNKLRVSGARQMGQEVLEGEDALAVLKFGAQSDQLGGDYVYLDKPAPELTDDNRPLAKVLKGYTAPVLILHPEQHTLRPIATIDTVKRELKARDALRVDKRHKGDSMTREGAGSSGAKSKSAKADAASARLDQERGIEHQVRLATWQAIADHHSHSSVDGEPIGLPRVVRLQIARVLVDSMYFRHDDPGFVKLREEFLWNADIFKGRNSKAIADDVLRLVERLDDDDLDAFLTLILPIVESELDAPPSAATKYPTYEEATTLWALATAPEYAGEVDLAEIRKQAVAEWDAQHEEAAAPKAKKTPKAAAPAAKKTAAKKAPAKPAKAEPAAAASPAPARQPQLGDTWRVLPGPGRAKTAGQEGVVVDLSATRAVLQLGPKRRNAFDFDQIEFVRDAGSPPTPTNLPPPAGDHLRAREAGDEPQAPDAAAGQGTEGQGAQAPQGGAEVLAHWVGQKVKVKGAKTIGEVSELLPSGGLLIATDSPSQPGTRNLTELMPFEVEVLPGQVVPEAAWPFPKPTSTREATCS